MTTKSTKETIGLVVGYIAFAWVIRFIVFTLTTHSFLSSHGAAHKIEEMVSANRVLLLGLSAVLYVLTLHALRPLVHFDIKELLNFSGFKSKTSHSAILGLYFSLILLVSGWITGTYQWLGLYFRLSEIVYTAFSIMIFLLSFITFSLLEEFLIRKNLFTKLKKNFGVISSNLLCAITYIIIKYFQFGAMSIFEILSLISLTLVLNQLFEGSKNHLSSWSFLCIQFCLLHLVFGLPYFGEDLPRLFLSRPIGDDHEIISSLMGGQAGPMSGAVFSLLLILFLKSFKLKKFATIIKS